MYYHRLISSMSKTPPYVGLLDTYTNAKAAYSLRRLSSTYTGAAIRVRRSSDSTTLDVGFNADGTLNTSAMLSFVGAGNGFVSIWYDQSGNGYNLSQVASANQLRIVSAGVIDVLNGKPSIYNSGDVFRFMKVSFGANLTQPNTYFHLGSHTNANAYVLDNFATSRSAIYQNSNSTLRLFANTDLTLTYTPNISTQRLIFAMANSTTSRLGVNGAAGVTGNAGTGTMDGITLSANYLNAATMVMNHQELIVFNSNQLTNRTGIESNINSYYSTY